MPFAADVAADAVSSERWAQASKPVIVYCVSRKPSGSTASQNVVPPVVPSPKPELLNRSVKTKPALWCWSGTMIRMSTTTAAPTTCHHTEMLFITAIR